MLDTERAVSRAEIERVCLVRVRFNGALRVPSLDWISGSLRPRCILVSGVGIVICTPVNGHRLSFHVCAVRMRRSRTVERKLTTSPFH